MTRMLETYLQIAKAGANERKSLINTIPRELTAWDNAGEIKRVRALLLSDTIESTTLIQTEVLSTVLEGAKKQVCFREASPLVKPMPSKSVSIPIRTGGRYAPKVGEASEIPIRTSNYTTITITADKVGERPMITGELMEDGLFSVLEAEIQESGASIENAINQDVLTALLDGSDASTEWDTTGSNQGIKAVARAAGLIRKAGFIPDSIVMSPEFEANMATEFVPSNYEGAQQVMTSGKLGGKILGLTPYVCGVDDASASYAWEYNSDGDIGALVFDSTRAYRLGIRRDISAENYNDPVKDMKGAVITARYGVTVAQAKAIARIEY